MADHGTEGGALKGLRLITMNRGPEGYGFHMYTNRKLNGQYVKSIAANGPADLAGLLQGDHVLQVDGEDVTKESHHQVVERIRSGDGKRKTLLVIDHQTEVQMTERGEELTPQAALVMIARSAIRITEETGGKEETDGGAQPVLQLTTMSDALPKRHRKREVKQVDWKTSVQAYNDL